MVDESIDVSRMESSRRSFDNLSKSMGSFGGSLTKAAGNIEDAAESFVRWAAGASALGLAFAGTVNILQSWTEHYRTMIDVGQTFEGSMVNMSQAAANSALTLEQYSKFVSKNGVLAVKMGIDNLSEFSREVRLGSMSASMYGLTMDEMNERSAAYLNTQMILGQIDTMNRAKHVQHYAELEEQMLGLSNATGKSREEILNLATSLMQAMPHVYGYLKTMPKDMSEAVSRSFTQASVMMSALPEEAGKTMIDALGSGMAQGSVWLNKEFSSIAVLLPQFGTALDSLTRSVKEGGNVQDDVINVMEQLETMTAGQYDMLARLSAHGDQAATQMLTMVQSMEKVGIEEFRRRLEEKARFGEAEQTFLTFGQLLTSIGSRFRLAFLGIAKIVIERIQPLFEKFNNFMAALIDPTSDSYKILIEYGNKFADIAESFVTGFMKFFMKPLEDGEETLSSFDKTMQAFGVVASVVTPLFSILAENIHLAIGAFIAFKLGLVSFLTKNLFGGLADKFSDLLSRNPLGRNGRAGRGIQPDIDTPNTKAKGGGLAGLFKGLAPAATLMGFGVAFMLIADSLVKFEEISWESLAKGGAVLGTLTAAVALLGTVGTAALPGMLPIAGVFVSIGAALWLAAPAFEAMSGVLSAFGVVVTNVLSGVSGLFTSIAESLFKIGTIDSINLTGVAVAVGMLMTALAGGTIANGLTSIFNLFSKSPSEKIVEMAEAAERFGPGSIYIQTFTSSLERLVSMLDSDALDLAPDRFTRLSESMGNFAEVVNDRNFINTMGKIQDIQIKPVDTEREIVDTESEKVKDSIEKQRFEQQQASLKRIADFNSELLDVSKRLVAINIDIARANNVQITNQTKLNNTIISSNEQAVPL